MKNKLMMAVVGGIAGTLVMTLFMMMGPSMGLPRMDPPQLLADMLGTSIQVGWVMHFMIGIIFALLYAYIFLDMLKGIANNMLKGVVFGIITFLIAQITMVLMAQLMEGMPAPGADMVPMMIVSLVTHIIFGTIVALFVKD